MRCQELEISGFVTEDGGAGEANVILPLSRPSAGQLFFIGADGRFGEGGTYDVGAYLGYRSQIGDGVLGAWAGVDRLGTSLDHDFNRLILGAEYFGSRLIVRANGFVPFDNSSNPWTIDEGAVITTYVEEVPSGIDAEAGLRFFLPPVSGNMRPSELRTFAGVYDYFDLEDGGGDVVGGRGRLELDLYPFEESPDTRLSFEVAYSNDSVADDQVSGGIRLSIPLGTPVSSASVGYGGSMKDTDPVPHAVASGGADLFEPVRRNREAVSRVAIMSQIADPPVVVPPEEPAFVLSMSNACRGPGGRISGISTPVGEVFDAPFDGSQFDLGGMQVATGPLAGQTLSSIVGRSGLPGGLSLISTYSGATGSKLTVRVNLRTGNGQCTGSSEVEAASPTAIACTLADLGANLGITIDNAGNGSDGCTYSGVTGEVVDGDVSACGATSVACSISAQNQSESN